MNRDEIEKYVYQLNQSIKIRYGQLIEKSKKSTYTYSSDSSEIVWDHDIKELGINVIIRIANGVVNDEWMVVSHPEYTIHYHRSWPDYSLKGDKRLKGHQEFDWAGNVDIIKQHSIFMLLSQE